MTFRYDQVHLGVPDPRAAVAWYATYLGGAPGDYWDRVMFGETRFIFLQNDTPRASAGSVIDRLAIAVPNLPAALQQLTGSGATWSELQDHVRSVRTVDPWGTTLDIVETTEGHGLQHAHLTLPDPDAAASWYLRHFGGDMVSSDTSIREVRYRQVSLKIKKGHANASAGHSVDHIGFGVGDLLAVAVHLKQDGVNFTTDVKPGPGGSHTPKTMAFVQDPWGTKIELLERDIDAPAA